MAVQVRHGVVAGKELRHHGVLRGHERARRHEVHAPLHVRVPVVQPGVQDGELLIPSAFLKGMIRPVAFRIRLDEAA